MDYKTGSHCGSIVTIADSKNLYLAPFFIPLNFYQRKVCNMKKKFKKYAMYLDLCLYVCVCSCTTRMACLSDFYLIFDGLNYFYLSI